MVRAHPQAPPNYPSYVRSYARPVRAMPGRHEG